MQKLPEPAKSSILPSSHSLALPSLLVVATNKASMLYPGEMLIVKRHTQLCNRLEAVRLQLGRVHGINLRSQYLHRHRDFVDVLLRQERRMARRDAIHERWLVLLRTQAEDGPPPVAEAHGADLLVLLSQGPGAIEDLGLAYFTQVFSLRSPRRRFGPNCRL